MKPFRAVPIDASLLNPDAYRMSFKVGMQEAIQMVAIQMKQKFFVNDVYSVQLSPPMSTDGEWWPKMHKLSVMRIDHKPIHNWADMQEIKNLLLGPEHEAVEVFPAESRLVDMGPQYHMWVFEDPQVRVPIGWKQRMVKEEVHKS